MLAIAAGSSHNFSSELRSFTPCSTPHHQLALWWALHTLVAMDGPLVFRSIYVDMDVDEKLRAQAAKEGVSKGEMCRRYLRAGLVRMNKASPIPAAPKGVSLGMRAVYLAADMDTAVRSLAREARALQTDVIRCALRRGMKLLESRAKRGIQSPAGHASRVGGRG